MMNNFQGQLLDFKIPKVIHTIWAGGSKLMDVTNRRNVLNWLSCNPGFEVWLWVDELRGTQQLLREEYNDKFRKAAQWLSELNQDSEIEKILRRIRLCDIEEKNINSIRVRIVGHDILRLHYQVVLGSGHCLFNAVVVCAFQCVQTLRCDVAKYLKSNPNDAIIFRSFSENVEDIVEGICCDRCTANDEMTILMKILNRTIVVIKASGIVHIPSDIDNYEEEPIFVYCNEENHYDALLPLDEYNSQQVLEIIKFQIQNNNSLESLQHQIIYDDEQKEQKDYPICTKYIRYEIDKPRPNYGASSDMLRYRILYKYGGFYFDSDVKISGNELLEDLCNQRVPILFVDGNSQGTGQIGNDAFVCTRKNSIMKALYDEVIERYDCVKSDIKLKLPMAFFADDIEKTTIGNSGPGLVRSKLTQWENRIVIDCTTLSQNNKYIERTEGENKIAWLQEQFELSMNLDVKSEEEYVTQLDLLLSRFMKTIQFELQYFGIIRLLDHIEDIKRCCNEDIIPIDDIVKKLICKINELIIKHSNGLLYLKVGGVGQRLFEAVKKSAQQNIQDPQNNVERYSQDDCKNFNNIQFNQEQEEVKMKRLMKLFQRPIVVISNGRIRDTQVFDHLAMDNPIFDHLAMDNPIFIYDNIYDLVRHYDSLELQPDYNTSEFLTKFSVMEKNLIVQCDLEGQASSLNNFFFDFVISYYIFSDLRKDVSQTLEKVIRNTLETYTSQLALSDESIKKNPRNNQKNFMEKLLTKNEKRLLVVQKCLNIIKKIQRNVLNNQEIDEHIQHLNSIEEFYHKWSSSDSGCSKYLKLVQAVKKTMSDVNRIRESQPDILGLTCDPKNYYSLFNVVALNHQNEQPLEHMISAYLNSHFHELIGFITTFEKHEDIIRNICRNKWREHVIIAILMKILDLPIVIIKANGTVHIPSDIDYYHDRGKPIFVYYNDHNCYNVLQIADGYDSRKILIDIRRTQHSAGNLQNQGLYRIPRNTNQNNVSQIPDDNKTYRCNKQPRFQ